MLIVLLIAVSLSMDAFSLSLAYGMNGFSKKNIFLLSFTVGIFHFIMPLFGMIFGKIIFSFINNSYILIAIIFIILAFEMIYELINEEELKQVKSIFEILAFSFAVSIDSFSTGIGILSITSHYFYSFILFSIFSFFFTFLGLIIGKFVSKKIGKYSLIIGSIILFLLGIYYLFI